MSLKNVNYIVLYRDFWRYIEFILNTIGITRFNATPLAQKKRRLLSVFCALFIFWESSTCLSMVLFVTFENEQFQDILTLAAFCVFSTFTLLSIAKIVKILYHSNCLQMILNEINELYPSIRQQQLHPGLHLLLKRNQYWSFRYAFMFHIAIAIVTITFFSCIPFITAVITYRRNSSTFEAPLPYYMYIPFKTTSDTSYGITYVMETISGLLIVPPAISSDLIFLFPIIQLIIQFEWISLRLREYRPVDGVAECDINFLATIVKQHNQIFELVHQVNKIFQFSIFFNFFCSASIICLMSFMAMVTDEYGFVLRNLSSVVYQLYEVFLISIVSTRLKEASLSVGYAAYEQEWTHTKPSYQKSISLIIARAQRPALIKGYIIKSADMEAFRDVVLHSYKFCAALNAIYNRKEGLG